MIFSYIYKWVIKPILFKIDPEIVHDSAIYLGELTGKLPFLHPFLRFLFLYKDSSLLQTVDGIEYQNPVGLAGGFDKDGRLTRVIPNVGFGFHEVGSVTAHSYGGNSGKRLIRLKQTRSIWVNYGLKNDGAKVIHDRLASRNHKRGKNKIPLCINVAKTNSKNTAKCEVAVKDYLQSIRQMKDIADLFTINISCPNAYGGQPFHDPRDLEKLLSAIDSLIEELNMRQPFYLKISPDLTLNQVDAILEVCSSHHVNGFILSNLRKERVESDFKDSEGALIPTHGGLSGKYQKGSADKHLKYIARKVKLKEIKPYTLIGLGGIFTAEDAYEKIKNGADLLELITGMIFEGPSVVSQINKDLAQFLKRDGYASIQEAKGTNL